MALPELMIRHLQELARQLQAAPRHADVQHACAIAATIGHLKVLVADDGLGRRIDSVPELVIRAQLRIVRAALTELGELAADPLTRRRLDTRVLSPFDQLEDWISYVAHELNGSVQGWINYREDAASEPEPYRAALREAHTTLRRLAEQSKATPFLREVMRRAGWPALHVPCAQIATALTIPIDVEFRVPLVVISAPTRSAPPAVSSAEDRQRCASPFDRP